ncbi:MAG TPA: FtsH protease activity modulator HflK [Spirochaetia bacterium]|nr:MAG: HflK protein [Spirochaetes bacterium GWB1_36_13]HCL58089.1 FtsH protease activity modulator HflK [Spirochaetia bacterium]
MDQASPINFKNFRSGNIFKKIIGIIIAIMALILIFSSWFTISPEEVGVVLRFGKYQRTVESGLNFKIPFGVEDVLKVPVERQLKMEFGFRTLNPGINTEYDTGDYTYESLMLTGDLNAANVEWIVQYRIKDPYQFLFKVRNATSSLRDVTESLMQEVIGDRTVNEVLTVGRQEIATLVTVKLQEITNQYEMGIQVDQVVLQDVNPPDKVKPSFNRVNEAQQEKEKLINQAWSEYNKIIPKAKGDAERTIEEAKGYALERINKAKGDANRFNALFKEYMKAKEVTMQRMYLETMGAVLQKVGKKMIVDDKTGGILPYLNLNQDGGK